MNAILRRIWEYHWPRALAGDIDSMEIAARLLAFQAMELGLL